MQEVFVDASFHLSATQAIPLDHGYGLFAGISRALPTLHHDAERWSVLPIRGLNRHDHTLSITEDSRLTIRLPSDEISRVLPLAGKQLDIQGKRVLVGIPELHMLNPAQELCARYVTIKGAETREDFRASFEKQLTALLGDTLEHVLLHIGARRVMQIKRYTVIGYTVGLSGLTEEQSILVQQRGFGGKRKMGAGVFLPQPVESLMQDMPGLEEEGRV